MNVKSRVAPLHFKILKLNSGFDFVNTQKVLKKTCPPLEDLQNSFQSFNDTIFQTAQLMLNKNSLQNVFTVTKDFKQYQTNSFIFFSL